MVSRLIKFIYARNALDSRFRGNDRKRSGNDRKTEIATLTSFVRNDILGRWEWQKKVWDGLDESSSYLLPSSFFARYL